MKRTILILLLLTFVSPAQAQVVNQSPLLSEDAINDSLLKDHNGNGVLEIIAFGDSITRGLGDFQAANQDVDSISLNVSGEAGYPLRIESLLGISVNNFGIPGEEIDNGGLRRFAQTIQGNPVDLIIINEGANDTIFRLNATTYFREIQTMVNLARAKGIEPIVSTLAPICCDREARDEFGSLYSSRIRELAAINDIKLADVRKAFDNACSGPDCFLLNRPEGLHPNTEGYDVMGEVVIATLLQIDIFAEDGAAKFEETLQLSPGSVSTEPDPVL